MDGALQARIKPHTANATLDVSSSKVKSANRPAMDSTDSNKTSFKDLLMNSNSDVVRERVAQKNGDLSGAKTDEEFFEALRRQTGEAQQRTPKNQLDKDAFLKLFVTQMQNQDPLNPDDSSEMAAQLAQFHGLEQMMNVNKTLEKMSADQALSRAVSLVNYVGKEVQLNGGKLRLLGGELTEAVFSLSQDVPKNTLEVRDGAGVVIATRDLGPLKAGEHQVDWDGIDKDGKKAQDGVYTFSIVAKGMNDEVIPATVTSTVRVTGVDLQDTNGAFHTELGKVKVSEIASVGASGYAKKPEKQDAAGSDLDSPGASTPLSPSVKQGAAKGAAINPNPASQAPAGVTDRQQGQGLQGRDQGAAQTAEALPSKGMPRPAPAAQPALKPQEVPAAGLSEARNLSSPQKPQESSSEPSNKSEGSSATATPAKPRPLGSEASGRAVPAPSPRKV